MENQEIVEKIAREGILKDIIRNIGGTRDEDLKDLEQDIYIDLLSKDNTLLNSLLEKDSLRWFLVKIAKNQIHSSNSRFYNNYKKRNKLKDDRHICDFAEILPDN